MSADPDAIVIGAGICGAAVAHELAARGRSVLVLDRLGVSAGTTGLGEGNVLVCDKPAGFERELARDARALWTELGTRFAAARVTAKGALLVGASGDPGLDDATGSGATVDGSELAGLEPALAPGLVARHEPGDLQVDPAGLTQSLLDGLPVRTGAEVRHVAAGRVVLNDGSSLSARDVIIAAGPWSGPLTGLPIVPRKGQLVALAAAPGLIRHKLIEAAYVSAASSDAGELQIATVIEQTLDGDEVLVGSSREAAGFDLTVDPAVTEAMLARAARFVPALAELEVTRAWAGLRPWRPGGLPAVGALGDGVWTSCGHEGSGVCFGPLTGRLLAQLICGEPPLVDPAPLAPPHVRCSPGAP